MKKKRFNKKSLIAMAFCAILLGVGGTIAVNNTVHYFENDFHLTTFQVEVSEKFESPDDWMPCDETEKLMTIRNKSDYDTNVRIKVDEYWTSKDGNKLELVKDGVKLAIFELANDDWELRDGYYYLKETLDARSEVEFIKSVTFNCAADFGENEMVNGDNVVSRTSDEYNGASYHLVATAQFVQDLNWEGAFEWAAPQTFSALKSGFSSRWGSVKQGRTVKAFKRSKVLPDSNSDSVSAMTSFQDTDETPIYFWYSTFDNTIYWYSTADAISWNANDYIGGIFSGMLFSEKPDDVSGFEYFDMRKLTSVGGLFYGNYMPDDLSSLAHWDMSGVSDFAGLFSSQDNSTNDYYFKQKHESAVEFWNVSNVKSFSGMLNRNPNITSLEFLKNWRPTELTNLDGVFYNMPSLRSLSGLEGWQMPKLTSMSGAFSGDSLLTSLSPIRNWDVSKVTNLGGTFSGCSGITDISVLSNWDVSKVTSFNGVFNGASGITDISALSGWNVSSGTDFRGMFRSTGVSNATSLNGWSVSDEALLSKMFDDTNCTEATYPSWYTADRRSDE